MATKVVLVQPDPFAARTDELASFIPTYDATGKLVKKPGPKNKLLLDGISEVSRPTHGFMVKENTYAYVQVIKATGEVVRVFNRLNPGTTENYQEQFNSGAGVDIKNWGAVNNPDTSEPRSAVWTDWILSGVREQRMEKTQVVETFGDSYLYAFGEKPRSLVFTGILMNTSDYNWKAVFWENWDRFFRASKLVAINARMYLGWDDVIVEGYPINAVVNQSADSPNALSFSFTFFVTNYINIAARSGFRHALTGSLGSVRRGHEDFSGRLGPRKTSILDLLGVRKPDLLAQKAYEAAKLAQVSPETAELIGKSVGQLAYASQQNAYAVLSGDANNAAFQAAHTARQSLEFFQGAKRLFVDSFEESHGLRSGTLNLWFGKFTSMLPDSYLRDLGVENPANFKGLTLDRILQGMAYNTAGLVGKSKGELVPGPKPGVIAAVTEQ